MYVPRLRSRMSSLCLQEGPGGSGGAGGGIVGGGGGGGEESWEATKLNDRYVSQRATAGSAAGDMISGRNEYILD